MMTGSEVPTARGRRRGSASGWRGPRRSATVDAGICVAEPAAEGAVPRGFAAPLQYGASPCGAALWHRRLGGEHEGEMPLAHGLLQALWEAVQPCHPRILT